MQLTAIFKRGKILMLTYRQNRWQGGKRELLKSPTERKKEKYKIFPLPTPL